MIKPVHTYFIIICIAAISMPYYFLKYVKGHAFVFHQSIPCKISAISPADWLFVVSALDSLIRCYKWNIKTLTGLHRSVEASKDTHERGIVDFVYLLLLSEYISSFQKLGLPNNRKKETAIYNLNLHTLFHPFPLRYTIRYFTINSKTNCNTQDMLDCGICNVFLISTLLQMEYQRSDVVSRFDWLLLKDLLRR